jgi:hypothetical protein
MNPLNLAIENGLRVNRLAGGGFVPTGKLCFCFALGVTELGLQAGVAGQRFDLLELFEIGDPTVAEASVIMRERGWLAGNSPTPEVAPLVLLL